MKKIFLAIIIASWLSTFCKADELVFKNSFNNELIGKHMLIFIDSLNLNAEEILKKNQFVQNDSEIPNLGLLSDNIWLKFKVSNVTTSEDLFLRIDYPLLDEVILYSITNNRVTDSVRLSQFENFGKRKYDVPTYLFDLYCPTSQQSDFLIKISASEQVILPIRLTKKTDFWESWSTEAIISGIYIGIVLIMFVYNLFIYFTVRDKSYLYYVAYIGFVGLTQVGIKGLTFKYLWPNFSWLELNGSTIFGALASIAACVFMKEFLRTKENARKLDYGLTGLIVLFGISILASVLVDPLVGFQLMQMATSFFVIYALILSYIIMRRGYGPAKFFFLGWSVLLVGAIVFLLKDFGVLPYNNVTNYTMQAASAVEMALLSFALADRINILKKEKEESQAQALRVSQENERLVLEQNVILEQKVEERTEELRESNKDLNTALDTLKAAQSQLVDAEKMASLGQLTAGIAHEINNPINFVTSNIKPLQRDIQDMLSLIEKYNEIDQDVDLAKKLSEIKDYRDDLDVDYVIEEMDSLLKGIDEGAQRTAEIVRGLKNFSRLDEAELKDADINEGLLSTLTVLNSNISRSEVNLSKELGELPVIECYPGKLNQVFMNIITNGVQAVNDNPEGKEKKILVKSDLVGDNIVIRIKDNGPGIPDDVRAKIFEPFFTTKDVGEGTGLGLSIVHSIIESHKGEIVLESAPGEGTEFIISLPVKK